MGMNEIKANRQVTENQFLRAAASFNLVIPSLSKDGFAQEVRLEHLR